MAKSKQDKRASLQERRTSLRQQKSVYESIRARSVLSLTDHDAVDDRSSKHGDSDLISNGSNVIRLTIDEDENDDENDMRDSMLSADTAKELRKSNTALQRLQTAVKTAAVTNELLVLLNDSVAAARQLKSQVGPSQDEQDDDGAAAQRTFKAAVNAISLIDRRKKIVVPPSTHERNAGEYTIVAFVNSASGGGEGQSLYKTLQRHLGESYVIDLKSCRPGNMPEDTLFQYAADPMVRVLACGGDGTCGWIFSSLDKVWLRLLGERSSSCRIHLSKYKDHLPVAILPLGTGNDLSREFHWGGKFREGMKKKSMIRSIQTGRIAKLDRWRCVIIPFHQLSEYEKTHSIPNILLQGMDGAEAKEKSIRQFLLDEGKYDVSSNQKSRVQKPKSPSKIAVPKVPSTHFFDGVFCNYLSLGFDATIAYLFHHEREMHPERFTSPLKNKLIYVQKSPAAFKAPKLRGCMKIMVAREDGELVNLPIPKSCRAVIVMNIRSYGGGNHLAREGSPVDGLVEVIFVSNLIRTITSVGAGKALPFMLFNVAAQTNRIIFKTTRPLHCQVDGEPWLQSEGVVNVRFHARNAILEKVTERNNCDCMSNAEDAVVDGARTE